MKAKVLVEYLNALIDKADDPDELEVFNDKTKVEIQSVAFNSKVDSNDMCEEKIVIL